MIKLARRKTLALIGLALVLVIGGLFYWIFRVVELPSSPPKSKAEIFSDAFGRKDFKLAYGLMAEDYQEMVPESVFVYQWEKFGPILDIMQMGEYRGVRWLDPDKYKLKIRTSSQGRIMGITADVFYEVLYSRGSLSLMFQMVDGNADSSVEAFAPDDFKIFSPTSTPTPKPGEPLS